MNLGIIGSGKIVHDFLTIANQIKSFSIIGISSTKGSIKVLEELQSKYSIPDIYTNNERLLSNPNIDTVYVAVPNVLHFSICKQAINNNKNVICEKPMVYTTKEAQELKKLANEHEVYIVEAITNIYLDNFGKIKSSIDKLGKLHIVSLNYTQYSTRYDELKNGNMLPVFDPQKGGGALMDLEIYNIHLAVGLFGFPDTVEYIPNYQYGTDTSGVIIMKYPSMICVMIASKDSYTDTESFIEGENGSLVINGLINQLPSFTIQSRNGKCEEFSFNKYNHRMISEFNSFIDMFDTNNTRLIDNAFNHSLDVLKVLEMAKHYLHS